LVLLKERKSTLKDYNIFESASLYIAIAIEMIALVSVSKIVKQELYGCCVTRFDLSQKNDPAAKHVLARSDGLRRCS
jgi:hypothetical protein